MKKFVLIDGFALIFRAYYAFIKNPLKVRNENSKYNNMEVSAVYGFFTMVLKIFEEFKPDYVSVVFDTGKPTFRNELYTEYKANRKETPEPLVYQIPIIKEFAKKLNLNCYEVQGFEADDVLASISKKYEEFDKYVITGDKDLLQILEQKNTKVVLTKSGISELAVFDRDAFFKEYGFEPLKLIDYKAIAGDSSDNIPGIKGIGDKGAKKLIAENGSLEGIYENVVNFKKNKQREKIELNKDMAFLSKKLATIDQDVEIKDEIDYFKYSPADPEILKTYLNDFNFNRYLKTFDDVIAKLSNSSDVKTSVKSNVTNEKTEKISSVKEYSEKDVNYIKVVEEKQFEALLKELEKSDEICIDLETDALSYEKSNIIGISISIKEKEAYYIPVFENKLSLFDMDNNILDSDYVFSKLKPILESDKLIIGHNLKFEMINLEKYGVKIKEPIFDTMVASYLLNPSNRRHNLFEASLKYLNYKMIPIEDLIGKGKKAISMADVDIDRIVPYACEDADITLRLKNRLIEKLKEMSLFELFNGIEMKILFILKNMEQNGIKLDIDYLKNLNMDFIEELRKLEDIIFAISDEKFNINSPKQLGEILFDKLKLPTKKKTKTGAYSTNISVLEELKNDYEIVEFILNYRSISKLKSTYVEGLPKLIYQNDKKLHTSYNQAVAASGRLSSSDPNLQNIPSKNELGQKIRKAFIVDNSENIIISADYSQIELRLLAHFSQDENLMRCYQNEIDIHSQTASEIFEKQIDDVDSFDRKAAKVINFGIIYGMGAFTLSKALKISVGQAKDYIQKFFEKFPRIKNYMDQIENDVMEKEYVNTEFGRIRTFYGINEMGKMLRAHELRAAINHTIQGTAADLIKKAMIDLNNIKIKDNLDFKILLQVHDELVIECHESKKDEYCKVLKNIMENAYKFSVPIKVDVKYGKNLKEMEKFSF